MSNTTPTLFELKGRARELQKQLACKLHTTQQMVAKAQGFANWQTLSAWYERHKNDGVLPTEQGMTAELLAYLDQVEENTDRTVFEASLILAYDVKDGQSFELGDDFEWCNETGEQICYRSVLRSYLQSGDGSPLSLDDVADVLADLVFFRHPKQASELTFERAYEMAMQRCFFHPTYLWLNGTFIDLGEIPEIKVGGKVVRRTTVS